ncbi:MAG: DoxX family protein [Bacteroidota bacterium]|nr:DoxX family protein [Bacteroidota bacterium]
MNAITSLGKYFFAVPMLIFGVFHFLNAEAMSTLPPFGGAIMIYIVGAALIAFALSVFIGKFDKLAAVLLFALMLLFIALLHMKGALAGDQGATTMLLKDMAIAGAALMYAHSAAKDNAVIG